MRKKTSSSNYHIENYIQMQKLNCILKILFSNEDTPYANSIRSKQNGALEFAVTPGY